jgi:hypothetical protein
VDYRDLSSAFVAEFKWRVFWTAAMSFCFWDCGVIALHQVNKMNHTDGRIITVFQFALLHMSNYCMQAERILTLSSRLFCIAVR